MADADISWSLLQHWKASNVFSYITATWIVYWLTVGIYRIYLHPLSKFPGPKLAALTFWYEFYYDVYPHRFQYLWKIQKLHEQFGPIVRINPYQLHIHDHDYFDTIYASGSNHKRNRCSWSHHSGSKAMGGSMLESMDHDLHRIRRGAISNFFSKQNVQTLEPLVMRNVEKLLQRFQDEKDDRVVNLNNAFAAMTMDIISEYCFGESMDSLSNPEYGKEWLDMLHQGVQMRPFARQFPWIINTIMDIPPHIIAKLGADMARMNEWTHLMLPKIEKILQGEEMTAKLHRTIFHEIRDGTLPAREKEAGRLTAESHVLLGAGTETTARTLAVTTFYLMKHREIADKLQQELRTVLPERTSVASLPQLESLPYLTAIINEGLRVAHGVSARQPRIATEEDLVYHAYVIPRGTPVMESLYLLHTDPKIFPDPLEFKPERWLDNPELKRHWFAFGRGSRNCLGMNLAISELYLATALLWRRLDLVITDTVEERDVWTTNDCFIGMTALSSEGIKAKILGEN